MMYRTDAVIQDFARRTRQNLAEIERLKAEGKEVYETTQLINSMLGLLVFPQQTFYDNIPTVPVDQLIEDGWPVPDVVEGFTQVKTLFDLTRMLRNAVTHSNIEFIADERDEVSKLRLWNVNPRTRMRTWEVVLSLGDLRRIADLVCDLIFDDPRLRRRPHRG